MRIFRLLLKSGTIRSSSRQSESRSRSTFSGNGAPRPASNSAEALRRRRRRCALRLAAYSEIPAARGLRFTGRSRWRKQREVRRAFEEYFQPSLEKRSNRYAWYGTHQTFDRSLPHFPGQPPPALVVGHCYRIGKTDSTFVVDARGHLGGSRFPQMSEEESRRTARRVRERLAGTPCFRTKSVMGQLTA